MKYAIGVLCLVLLLALLAGCVTAPPGLPGGPGTTTTAPTGESTTVPTGEPTTVPATTVTTAVPTGESTTATATSVTTATPTGEATAVATATPTGDSTTATATTVATATPTGTSTGAPDTPGVTATTGAAVATTTVPVPSTTPGAEPPSTTLPLVLIGIVGLAAIIGIGWWMMTRKSAPADDQIVGAAAEPDGPSSPIRITSAPPAGSTAQVVGTVDPELRADHRVLVYINVRGRWWGPKPEDEDPFTRIEPDGSWRCTILTGGEDQLASEVAAYLVPSTLTIAPPAPGLEYLPMELSEYPFVSVNR